jgi:colicin import membrane protein
MPISPPATTGDVRKDSHTVSTTSNARRDDEAPAPARAPAQSKAIVAQRDPALEAWFIKSYLRCWTPPSTLPQGERYAAQVRIVHNLDGSLSNAPALVNPPIDPEWRAYADSAVRAVMKCNPLQVPPRYLSQFGQWRKMTLHFSPDSEL